MPTVSGVESQADDALAVNHGHDLNMVIQQEPRAWGLVDQSNSLDELRVVEGLHNQATKDVSQRVMLKLCIKRMLLVE